jgi:hypothetical protein
LKGTPDEESYREEDRSDGHGSQGRACKEAGRRKGAWQALTSAHHFSYA